MRKLQRLAMVCGLLLLAFSVQAAAEMRELKGVVVDHHSRKSLDQVNIGVFKDDALLKQELLEADGMFTLNFEYDDAARYHLRVLKKNYADDQIELTQALIENTIPAEMKISLGGKDQAFYFKGKVLDRITRAPVAGSAVRVLNNMTGEITRLDTDANGTYSAQIKSGYEYSIITRNDDFLKRYSYINFCKDTLSDREKYCFKGFTDLSLDPKGGVTAATTLVDKIVIGKKFKVDNIYYDYNKASLRKDALPNLDKLQRILADNKQLVIELGSHADARGSDQYNLDLSQRRAESAVSYILEQGTLSERITAKGYGESVPFNHCVNNVKCSKAQHEANRRTEFTIVDINKFALNE